MAHNSQFSATNPEDYRVILEEVVEGHQVSYLTIINSLKYLILRTYPDIAYGVGTLSCFSAKPKLAHWEAAKYPATKNMELRFDGTELSMDLHFYRYTDVRWSQDPDNSPVFYSYAIMDHSPDPVNSKVWLYYPLQN